MGGVEVGSAETLAAEPSSEELFAIAAARHGTELGNQRLVDRQGTAVNGESSGGEQHVVEEIGSRAMTADHEDGAAGAVAGRLMSIVGTGACGAWILGSQPQKFITRTEGGVTGLLRGAGYAGHRSSLTCTRLHAMLPS